MSIFQPENAAAAQASVLESPDEAALGLEGPQLSITAKAESAVPSIGRMVLALALPTLLDQFLQMLLLWSDTYLAGRITPARVNLSAVGMGGQIMMILNVLFTAIGVGATAIVARSIGAGHREQANRTARQAMILGCLIGTVTAGLMWVFAPQMLTVLGLTNKPGEPALDYATTFVRCFLPGLTVGAMYFMGNACLRGAGDTVGALLAIAVANAVNISVGWTLSYPWRWGPQMGVKGIGIGTLCGYLAGGIYMLHMVHGGRRRIHVRLLPISIDFGLIRRMLRVGVFAGLESAMFATVQTLVVGIVAPLGTVSYAAYMLTIRIEAASFLPGFAFSVAGGALVGQSLGAGLPKRAAHCGWWSYFWGGGIMTLMGVVFIFWPGPLVGLFADKDPEVAAKAIQMLRICGFIQPFLGMIMVFAGCLKGAGDTRFPAAITFSGVVAVRAPGAWIASRWGVLGVWYIMMADLVVRGTLLCLRFAHGGWKKSRV